MHPSFNPALLLALALAAGCAAAVDDPERTNDSLSPEEVPEVAATVQALAGPVYPRWPMNEESLWGAEGCLMYFQYGNFWASAYAKARMSDQTCDSASLTVLSWDGTNFHEKGAKWQRGQSLDWFQATIPWTNVVNAHFTMTKGGATREITVHPFP